MRFKFPTVSEEWRSQAPDDLFECSFFSKRQSEVECKRDALHIHLNSSSSSNNIQARWMGYLRGLPCTHFGSGRWGTHSGLMSFPLPSFSAHCDKAVERANLTWSPFTAGYMVHALTAIAAETWCRDPRPQESWHGDSAVWWERPGTQAAQIQCQLCDPRSAQIISLTKIEHKSHLTIFKQCGKIKIYLFTVYCLRLDYSATAWRLKPCDWLISCHYYTI